jgi:WD40 repeat protein
LGSVAFDPDGRRLAAGSTDGVVRVWDLGQPDAAPLAIRGAEASRVFLAFSPDGHSLFSATAGWGHRARFQGGGLRAEASRSLGGIGPDIPIAAFRFLDPSGERLQAAVLPTLESILSITLRLDTNDASPLPGDPEKLLDVWQRRLALKITGSGEVVEEP